MQRTAQCSCCSVKLIAMGRATSAVVCPGAAHPRTGTRPAIPGLLGSAAIGAHGDYIRTVLVPLLLAFLTACTTLPQTVDPASDAPEGQRHATAFKDAATYPQALQLWRNPEDVNAWIGAKFQYSMPRAVLLSESQRTKSGQLPIHAPQEFFGAPSGICVDLSRFAVETLRQINPELKANYLMVEFAPVTVAGNTLRMHWLASFERDGKHYFFADSKRPGHIAGPYASAKEFISEYSAYRRRSVVSFRELESYQRKQRTMASKRSGEERH